MSDIGLKNLCSEGFGASVYLYETNFLTAPKQVNCSTIESKANNLKYYQLTVADVDKQYSIYRCRGYDSIEKRIVDFQPLAQFKVSIEEQRQICE